MAEGARLERVYTVTRIEGSNPSLSAISFLYLKNSKKCWFVRIMPYQCYSRLLHWGIGKPQDILTLFGEVLVILIVY